MRRRIATSAAALAVIALLWSSSVVAFSRCAFACDMQADAPSCPLCKDKQPSDHAEVDVAVDRSCCDKQFKSSQVASLSPELAVVPLAPATVARSEGAAVVLPVETTIPRDARGPPIPRALSDRRTVVLLL